MARVLARAHGYAELCAPRIDVDQVTRVRVAREKAAIVQSRLDELVSDREQQRAVRAGPYRNPLVGDSGVTGAHGVDRNEAAATPLEFRDLDLERIRVMVFRGPDHYEQPRAVEVRPAEFPERAADRVDHSGGHIDRAEAPVGSVVRRSELTR